MRLQQIYAELKSAALADAIEVNFTTDPADPDAESAGAIDVVDVTHDSRLAGAGALFCAVPGSTFDGHDHVASAVQAGAVAALVERWVDVDIPQLQVSNVRQAMPLVAAMVHGHPSDEVKVFGITGTNGKTTTTQLLASIMAEAKLRCEVIGTLGGIHTTPEAPELQRQLRAHADAGVDVVALEVSSHALDQHRVDGTRFAVAAFSNLSPDHLDYHQDMDGYFEAKKRLFDGRAAAEVITIDDPWGVRLADERRTAMTVSVHDVEILHENIVGTDFMWRGQQVHVPLPGTMNVANALMAAESALLLGLDEAMIANGLRSAAAVPGRMERVECDRDDRPTVIVDYSHTPDSIDRALATVRSVAPDSQVTIVFGCGGDRDRLKRPLMGRAAQDGADRVYLTNDNPRSEDPLLIIADALAGMQRSDEAIVEPDRQLAIRHAIISAGPNDVVLIAGKGHEKTQTIGSDVLPFDDVSVARNILEGPDS